MTNLDYIRHMSKDEMLQFLYKIVTDCDFCPAQKLCKVCMDCIEVLDIWLDQERTDDD